MERSGFDTRGAGEFDPGVKAYAKKTCQGFPPIGAILLAAGCSAAQPREVDRPVTRGLDQTDKYLAQAAPPEGAEPLASDTAWMTRPLALVDGVPITLDQVKLAFFEAAGTQILEEAVLDVTVAREAARRGIKVGQPAVEAERDLLLETFATNGLATGRTDAGRLMQQVRASRGLGDIRFAGLLRRNATLRALVAPDVTITPGAVEQAYQLRYGERRRARLIVTPTASAATAALERLKAGESFSALAAELSTDASAERGGVLEPISAVDPTYPAAVRSALSAIAVGEVSTPVAVDQGFAVLKLDEVVTSGAPMPQKEAVREQLERDVCVQQERVLMNQLARRLIEGAKLQIMEKTLERGWKERLRREAAAK